MFGYVRIHKPELLVREYEEYKSVYCGLCRTLGKEYGLLPKCFLSYDMSFLTLFYIALQKEHKPSFIKKRCSVNPLKKCSYCISFQAEYSFVAAVSIFAVYYKIRDNICDSKGIKKLLYRLLSLLFLRSLTKASKKFPDLNKLFSDYFENQMAVESSGSVQIDMASNPTAEIMSNVFAMMSDNEADKLLLKQFGFYLGRWIYLIDAADDIEEDSEKGSFNPFVNIQKENKDVDIFVYANEVLNFSLSRGIASFDLLRLYNFSTILNNILRLGMPMCQKHTLFCRKNKNKL